MFKTLYESFENPNVTDLKNNIVRYQSLEPNYTVINNQMDYSFPNAGTVIQQRQASNANLQAALNNLGTTFVPTTTKGLKESTEITDLGKVLTGIPDTIAERVKQCRKFQGLTGLSNLQKAQANQIVDERCGWRYKSGMGAIPQVAQAAYGNRTGPLDPAQPSFDKIGDGVTYYWDLAAAEKQMVRDICKAATDCVDMTAVPVSAVGDFSNLCGYCETSKKIIPIKTMNGTPVPRYGDIDSQCASDKIITMKDARQRCPVPPPGTPQAAHWKCLNSDKLDRDCIALTALFAGCSPQGTLVNALQSGRNPDDYAATIRNSKAFQTYQQLSQTPLSDDVIRSGNTTLWAAFMNNYNLNQNMYETDNLKRWVASVDLCRVGGLYDQWNFCSDLKDSERDYELKCMQQYFLSMGGTPQGTDYPKADNMARMKGSRSWGEYKQSVLALKAEVQSPDHEKQRMALNRFTGLGIQLAPTGLPRDDSTRGVEVFYTDRARNCFLGRRAYLSEQGKNLPNFNVGDNEVEQTGLRDNVLMYYIYDFRPDEDLQMALGIITDDGWAIARNQSVFNVRDWANAASWWYDQAPTWHNTSAFQIAAESRKIPNIFMGAWFENGGGAVFHPFYRLGQTWYDRQGQPGWREIGRGNMATSPIDDFWKKNCYFSQEIDAPTLSFEPYQPRFYYTPGLHFCERRLWGATELSEVHSHRTAQQVGYQFSKPQATALPKDQMILTLTDNTEWKTKGTIAFSAIRTWTLCFNIGMFKGRQNNNFCDLLWFSPAGQRWASVRVYDTGNSTNCDLELVYLGFRGVKMTRRITISQNKWYICVIRLHPEGQFSRSISRMSMFVQTLEKMRDGKPLDGISMLEILPGSEGVLFSDVRNNRGDAFRPVIGTVHGGGEQKKFHIAWLHGYDEVIDTNDSESWRKEATKGWFGRWFD